MKKKKLPIRKCIACNEHKLKNELIRIVKDKDDISVDFTGKKNGRGAYICKDINCFNIAKKKKILNAIFKSKIEDEIYDELIKEI